MDPMQAVTPTIPHLVQVYQPSGSNTKIQNPQIIHISHPSLPTSQGKVTYRQTITSESLQIPVTSHVTELQTQQMHMPQSQIVMSCQQGHLQSLHQPLQGQIPTLHTSDMSQQLHIASHVIVPQVFKQHVLVNGVQQQYYGQFEPYAKERCVVTKVEVEPDLYLNEKRIESKTENPTETDDENPPQKKSRNLNPNPTLWACNVRKLKHQRGEAYISRRGKLVPERRIKTTKDCLGHCKLKCNERINDTDREQIFKAFYSLNANEKKHYILNTTERHYVIHIKVPENHKRKYSFKYFFLVRAVKYYVCKNFYLGTLAISQKPVYNVHSGKSEMNIPKPDGRGLSEASTHALPSEVKDRVRTHILSFKTADLKPVKQYSKKKQFLESKLNVKKMYSMYCSESNKKCIVPVKESMYRKIFKEEFNIRFRKAKPDQLCCRCKGALKKK